MLYPLKTLSELELYNVEAELVSYQGRSAVKMVESNGRAAMAILHGSDFTNGMIETEIVGLPCAGAPGDARGFVGIAFRVQNDAFYECFYLRPTNGRANDQLRRNHATQYIAMPDYPWHKLRQEYPGVYESYTDLVLGEWTRIKIVVSGIQAQLYVNGAEQPCLIVNDLKLGERAGQIALWMGYYTEAYFSEVKVTS